MNRLMRLYFYGILGAIGGLIAWQTSSMLGLSFTPNLYLSEVFAGALIGLCIGLCIGFAEGILTRNPVQFLKASLISGALGLIGGAIALPVAEGFFQILGGEIWGRLLGWGLFGLLIGLATGITGGAQMWKGGLGGILGGLLGSSLLEAARKFLSDPLMGKAAGLILMGAAVGVFIALIVFVLSRVWLEVTSGKLKGTEFILDKFLKPNGPTAIIGSSPLKSEIGLPDPDVAPQHAILQGAGTHFTLKDISMNGTFVNNRRIEQTRLANRQTIKVGNTEMMYHEKR